MSVNINASLTAGLVMSSDTSGIINLQSGGTTVATISSTGLTSTGGALNGTLGATTPSTVVATTIGASGTISTTTNLLAGESTGTGYIRLNSASGNSNQIDWQSAGATKWAMGRNVGDGGANDLAIYNYNNSTTALILNSSGNLGLGVTPFGWSGSAAGSMDLIGGGSIYHNTTSNDARWGCNLYITGGANTYKATNFASVLSQADGSFFFSSAPSGTAGTAVTLTTKMTLDASGNLGLGVTPSAWNSVYKTIQLGGTSANYITSNSGVFGFTNNVYIDAVGAKYITTGSAASRQYQLNGAFVWENAPSGTAGAAVTLTTAMTLNASGNLLVGTTSALTSSATAKVHVGGSIIAGNSDSGYTTTSGIQQLMHKPAAEGNATNAFGNNGSTGFQIIFASVAAYGANGAATGIVLGKNSSTNRSINAGGTINASGADYAEYMTKSGDFVLAKGDVVGIDANGKLTNVYADAVSFVVKSTDPSYVGGDTWGVVEQTADNKKPPLTPEALEAARQLVDRIAFAGQVPVNVLGATAGQYIIPVNDNGAIKGEAVTSPTFEQYQTAVGKVIAIEADGRAKIIVKVA